MHQIQNFIKSSIVFAAGAFIICKGVSNLRNKCPVSQGEGYQLWRTLSYAAQTSLRKRMTYFTSSWECWLPSDMSPLWGLPLLKKAALPKVPPPSRGIHLLMSDWCEGVDVWLFHFHLIGGTILKGHLSSRTPHRVC